jgi:ring-1,2-phenylacetyl-CoA epoxidase subunit PaaD
VVSERVRAAVAAVRDPEISVLSIADLGILRSVQLERGRVVVTITPTYLGCPAMDVIRADIRAAALDAGCADVEIVTSSSPPWTTDWLSDKARAKLSAAGIAPPVGSFVSRPDSARSLPLTPVGPSCPRCGSADSVELTRFGSTACKALWSCRSCREPFEHMKVH